MWIASSYLILLFLCVIFTMPIFWLVLTSFKDRMTALAYPPKFLFNPTLDNYIEVLAPTRMPFTKMWVNSLIINSMALAISFAIGLPAAYAFSRLDFRGKSNLMFYVLSIRFAPAIGFLIPFYIIYRMFNLIDTHIGVTLIYQTISLPLVIWLMYGYFIEVPKELEEAAMVDGCSRLKVFFKITLPLVRYGLAATAILTLIFLWNELLFAFILTGNNAKTAPVGVWSYRGYTQIYWGQMAAASTLTMLPVLVFGIIMQRQLVRGLVLGALKG